MAADEDDALFESAEQAIALERRTNEAISRMRKVLTDFGLELEVPEADTNQMKEEENLEYHRRCTEAASLNLQFQYLACRILLTSSIRGDEEQNGEPPDDSNQSRMDIIGELWLKGLWAEPWIGLVKQELPGPDPDTQDFERFIGLAADRAIRSVENSARFSELQTGILEVLDEGGYPMEALDSPESGDARLIHQLIFQTVSKRNIDVRKAFEAKRLVRQLATEPDHPAWQVVIETYLTD